MAAVWDSALAPVDKLAMLALADWADDAGGSIYPAMSTAAKKASLGLRTLQRVVQRQLATGVLVQEAPAVHHRPARYRIDLDALRGAAPTPVSVTPVALTPVADDVIPPVRGAAQARRGAALTPNPSVSVSKKQPSGKKETARATRLPDLFPLTDDLRGYAERKGCRDPARCHEAFTNHYRGNGKTQRDWVATWRTWVLGAHGGPAWKACGCAPPLRAVGKQSVRDMARDIAAEWAAEEVG